VKARTVLRLVGGCFLLSGAIAFAGDLTCYGHTSTTSHFECLSTGNCVWWAAYKRPDLAAAITGSGWNGGEWYDKFRNLGFAVGSEPKERAVVEFSSPGHVAFVEHAYPDGSFDVSEMDAYGRLGSGGVYHATYYPDGGGKYHRNSGPAGGWTLKGFIYESGRAYDITLYRAGNVGWYPRVDICQNAEYWYRLSEEDGKTIADPVDKSVCNEVVPMCYTQ
jgi:hypothetical protein